MRISDWSSDVCSSDLNLVYPRTDQGLDALLRAPAGLARPERYRSGGYVRRLPADPWGNPYQYRQPGERGAFDIFSFGADGAAGGEGDGADIGNWNRRGPARQPSTPVLHIAEFGPPSVRPRSPALRWRPACPQPPSLPSPAAPRSPSA